MLSKNRALYANTAINTITLLRAISRATRRVQTQPIIPLNIISHAVYGNADGIENNKQLRRCVERGAHFFLAKTKRPLNQKVIESAIAGIQAYLAKNEGYLGLFTWALSTGSRARACSLLSKLKGKRFRETTKIQLILQLLRDQNDGALCTEVSDALFAIAEITPNDSTALNAQLLTLLQPTQMDDNNALAIASSI